MSGFPFLPRWRACGWLLPLSVLPLFSLVPVSAAAPRPAPLPVAQSGSESDADLGRLTAEAAYYRAQNFRRLEAYTLSRIGKKLAAQQQPELAIVFYKRALERLESVRADLRRLDRLGRKFDLPPGYLQQPLVATFADVVYRPLAELLLRQNRPWEAQQVLDLLKVEELNQYLKNVVGTAQVRPPDSFPAETVIGDRYGDLQQRAIPLGQELAALRAIPEGQLTANQRQRLATLVQAETQLNQDFNQFIASADVQAQLDQLSRTAQRQNINLEDLNSLRDNLRQLGQTVILYPLILPDRLELILTTPDAPPIRHTVRVNAATLNRAIADFRATLQRPTQQSQAAAQQLYQWLIQPVEAELRAAGAKTIIYAPDGRLRYVPLAALHDGQQWLIERFQVYHITARSLTDLTTARSPQMKTLAGAFAHGKFQIAAGDRRFTFLGLPFAEKEVALLQTLLPDTTLLLDDNFSRAAVVPRLNSYNIVHFATHATFLPGQPEDSFILFGDGDRATLRDVENWSLANVDLVVLSACETGVGGRLGNGEEILGLGYQFQRAGARAALASLWSVSDRSTQLLMNAFYANLRAGLSKADALRQAQLALITGEINASGGTLRGGIGVVGDPGATRASKTFAHPYYWAPFILIGNGR